MFKTTSCALALALSAPICIATTDFAAESAALNHDYANAVDLVQRIESHDLKHANFENTFALWDQTGTDLFEKLRWYNVKTMLGEGNDYSRLHGQTELLRTQLYNKLYDKKIYERLLKVATELHEKPISNAQRRLIARAMSQYHVDALSEEHKKQFSAGAAQLTGLRSQFQNLLPKQAKTSIGSLSNEEAAELPPSLRQQLGQGMEQEVNIPHQVNIINQILASCPNRATREKVWKLWRTASLDKNQGTTRHNIEQQLKLRHQQAKLSGFNNAAEEALQFTLLNSTHEVEAFLDAQLKIITPELQAEYNGILNLASQELNQTITALDPWDAPFYTARYQARLRQAGATPGAPQQMRIRPDFRPYLEFEGTLTRMHELWGDLYGIDFKEVKQKDFSTKGVREFEVHDRQSKKLIGSFYLDTRQRPGSSCVPLTENSKKKHARGFVFLNIPMQEGKLTLMTHDNLRAMMHEYGHLLQHLFTKTEFWAQGSTNLGMDVAELAGTLHGLWAYDPTTLSRLGRHHETGEAPPIALIENTLRQRDELRKVTIKNMLLGAKVDIALHSKTELLSAKEIDIHQAAYNELAPWQLPMTAPMPEQCAYTGHVFGGIYASKLYSYPLSEVLAEELFTKFQKEGVFSPELGQRLRETILGLGDSEHGRVLVERFLGYPAFCLPAPVN